MYYLISALCPRSDITLGAHGFVIHLHPGFKDLVAASGLDQANADRGIENCGNAWLDACGYSRKSEYDGERLHQARTAIRVSWGDWGLEHITVPGNACGLDIDHEPFSNPLRGPSLLPHNIDSWAQKNLLLIVFTFFAETLALGPYNPG